MSRLIADWTGQPFILPVMLTVQLFQLLSVQVCSKSLCIAELWSELEQLIVYNSHIET